MPVCFMLVQLYKGFWFLVNAVMFVRSMTHCCIDSYCPSHTFSRGVYCTTHRQLVASAAERSAATEASPARAESCSHCTRQSMIETSHSLLDS